MNPVQNTYSQPGMPRMSPQPAAPMDNEPATTESMTPSKSPFVEQNRLTTTASELQKTLPKLTTAALANLMLNQSSQPATYQQVQALRATYQMGPVRELPNALG